MSHSLVFFLAAVLFCAMVLLALASQHRHQTESEKSNPGFGVTAGAVFGLLGLLIAFTFAGAASRFDSRRQLIVQEVNAIGTAYLRLDLLAKERRAALQNDFRQYVEARLEVYRKLPDFEAAKEELARSRALQNAIWTKAVEASKGNSGERIDLLLLPALNEMFDVTTARTVALQTHTPWIVLVLLVIVALACAALAGDATIGRGKRHWLHLLVFAFVLALTVYVILDLEYPRAGLIRIQAVEQMLSDLRQAMN